MKSGIPIITIPKICLRENRSAARICYKETVDLMAKTINPNRLGKKIFYKAKVRQIEKQKLGEITIFE